MAFHIPFEHRNHGTPGSPIYIGFDAPLARSAPHPSRSYRWNVWALIGFPLSLFALVFTFGLLSPVALVLNLIGLRKHPHRPRKLAAVGTAISLLGTALVALFAFLGVSYQMKQHHFHQRAALQIVTERETAQTRVALADATAELTEYVEDNEGYLPTDIDACILMLKHEDAWGEPLRYDEQHGSGTVRSAGPDRTFDSPDDIVETVEGKTFRDALLPVK